MLWKFGYNISADVIFCILGQYNFGVVENKIFI